MHITLIVHTLVRLSKSKTEYLTTSQTKRQELPCYCHTTWLQIYKSKIFFLNPRSLRDPILKWPPVILVYLNPRSLASYFNISNFKEIVLAILRAKEQLEFLYLLLFLVLSWIPHWTYYYRYRQTRAESTWRKLDFWRFYWIPGFHKTDWCCQLMAACDSLGNKEQPCCSPHQTHWTKLSHWLFDLVLRVSKYIVLPSQKHLKTQMWLDSHYHSVSGGV